MDFKIDGLRIEKIDNKYCYIEADEDTVIIRLLSFDAVNVRRKSDYLFRFLNNEVSRVFLRDNSRLKVILDYDKAAEYFRKQNLCSNMHVLYSNNKKSVVPAEIISTEYRVVKGNVQWSGDSGLKADEEYNITSLDVYYDRTGEAFIRVRYGIDNKESRVILDLNRIFLGMHTEEDYTFIMQLDKEGEGSNVVSMYAMKYRRIRYKR